MKVFKNRLLMVVITAIICITGTAYATGQILASNITYNDTTVDQALDELYDNYNDTLTLRYSIGDHASNMTDLQHRFWIGTYIKKHFKYFKITTADKLTNPCTNVYFKTGADNTGDTLNVNDQYLTSTYSMIIPYISGNAECFYDIRIQFYN